MTEHPNIDISEAEVEAAREVFATFGQVGHLRAAKPDPEMMRMALMAAARKRLEMLLESCTDEPG